MIYLTIYQIEHLVKLNKKIDHFGQMTNGFLVTRDI
jgi:hypothetical protein